MVRFVALLVLVLNSASADDGPWNQFRGPRGDGTTTVHGLPVTIKDGPDLLWKTPLTGRGWSSPVVWGKQIWLTSGPEIQNLKDEKDPKAKLGKPIVLSALCFDLETGKLIHDLPLFEVDRPQFTHPTNSYASPTPYIEKDRVYIHFGTYGTACLDTQTGKTIWERKDLECDHFRGPGSSPVVYGNLLYLTFDGSDYQYFTALNKETGKTVFRKDRNVDFGTDDGDAKKAYSTPILIEVDKQQMVISPFASATIAYEPLTGEPLWTVHHGGMNAAGRPLFGNGLVYVSAADGPFLAVKPTGRGDITANIVWRTSKAVPKRPSQLLVGDLLFFINDSGVATCLDALTGKEVWSKRIDGDFWASPLLADGLIYCFSQDGKIPVIRAGREFELVGEGELEGGFVASPAVAGHSLILRSKTALYRVGK